MNDSDRKPRRIPPEETARQRQIAASVRERVAARAAETGRVPAYFVRTFGCQQNEADSERLAGMAEEMGYVPCASEQEADLILVNTCAVREHAEKRAFSVTGQYKHLKERNPDLIIGVCGCMVSQETRSDKIRRSYPYVSFLFGTSMLHRFPEILDRYLTENRRRFYADAGDPGCIAENIPVSRAPGGSAWLSVMYGCNNFCTYCIVPHVRGRERSRLPSDVLAEARSLVDAGYREITLLGQNVNSYGKEFCADSVPDACTFPELLSRVCALEGDFRVGFMTSHPKDASRELIDVMAREEKAAHRFHLPLQSGSDRVLAAMNRHYTSAQYFEILRYMREKIPDITVTTDIIVGFPTETEEEFLETLDAVRRARFDGVFTFIYSPRTGTPAAEMEGQIPDGVKQERLTRLTAVQNEILAEKNRECVGRRYRVLTEGVSKTNPDLYTGRTGGGKPVHFPGTEEDVGRMVTVEITEAETFHLFGKKV